MNPRIPKLREEHKKNADRIDSLTTRNQEIERKITELENTDIIGLVRQSNLTLDQVAALLESIKEAPMPTPEVHTESAPTTLVQGDSPEPESTGLFHREGYRNE